MRSPSVEWFLGLEQEDKDSFEKVLRGSTLLLTSLLKITEAKLSAIQKEESSISMYTEGYPYRQAFFNGRKAALKDIIRLVDFIQ